MRKHFKRVLKTVRRDAEPDHEQAGEATPQQPLAAAVSSSVATTPSTSASNVIPAASQDQSLTLNPKNEILQKIWDAAFARLKEKEPKLVERYHDLAGANGTPSISALASSLEKIDRLASKRSSLEDIQYVLKLKGVVASGLETSREASLAWSVVCTILEPLMNIGKEAVAHREGLQYIVDRLAIINKLTSLRLSTVHASDGLNDLVVEIRLRITALYTKILQYLVQSSVYHQQRAIKSYAKDALVLYDWNRMLQGVKDAEKAVAEDDASIKAEANTANLQILTDIAKRKEYKECLRQLRATDPRDDKKRIESDKGGLLQDTFDWILDNDDYKAWITESTDSSKYNSLWIRGDPGKGKTMLVCGIIDKLSEEDKKLAFFFCQATDPRLNTAENVIRGLLYMLAETDSTFRVLSLLQEKFDNAGNAAFTDVNTWIVVKDLFHRALEVLADEDIWIIVDALDECTNRDRLLDLINDAPENVKWLFSSRNWDDIEDRLELHERRPNRLSLELNSDSVAKSVNKFIGTKMPSLAKLKRLPDDVAKSVQEYLEANANGTFLWVALVCRNLSEKRCTRFNILELVKKFPPDLGPTYTRILDLVNEAYDPELLKQILLVAVTVFRPLSVAELSHLLSGTPGDVDYWHHLINETGFLTSQSSQVAFLHLSAKEFLLKSNLVVGNSLSAHQLIYERSIEVMLADLRRNPYNMAKVGCHVNDLVKPNDDPLANMAYPCLYWAQHLFELWPMCSDATTRVQNEALLERFCRTSYLYWIEALIWLKSLSHGMSAMLSLKRIFTNADASDMVYKPRSETTELYRDALRFVLSSANVQEHPLQVYASTLFFSPTSSLIRKAFQSHLPTWLKSQGDAQQTWPQAAVSFSLNPGFDRMILSPDWKLVLLLGFKSLEIRDAFTGILKLELKIDDPREAVFSPSSRFIFLVTGRGKLAKLDCSSGDLVIEVDIGREGEYVFRASPKIASSPNGVHILHSLHHTIYHRDANLNLLHEHEHEIERYLWCMALSPDGAKIAICWRGNLLLRDLKTWTLIWENRIDTLITDLAFDGESDTLVALSDGGRIDHFDTATGEVKRSLAEIGELSADPVSTNDLYLIYKESMVVKDVQSNRPMVIFKQAERMDGFAITPYWMISMSRDRLQFYDINIETTTKSVDMEHDKTVGAVVFCPNGTQAACELWNGSIRIWDIEASWQTITPFSNPLQTESSGVKFPYSLSFSYDDRLAICREDGQVTLWHTKGELREQVTFSGHSSTICSTVFARDGTYALYSWYSPRIIVAKTDDSILELNTQDLLAKDRRTNLSDVQMWNGVYLAAFSYGANDNVIPWMGIFDISGTGQLLHLLEFTEAPASEMTMEFCFCDNGNSLAYLLTYQDDGILRVNQIKIADGHKRQLIEIPWPGRRQEHLVCIDQIDSFYVAGVPLRPMQGKMEIYVDTRDVMVDCDLILRLPVEYAIVTGRVPGNRLVHVLSGENVSVLEFDIGQAVRGEN